MSRNKLEGRYAGKHNGRHYRGVTWKRYCECSTCQELDVPMYDPIFNYPSGYVAFSRRASWGKRGRIHKYSRKQRKANY